MSWVLPVMAMELRKLLAYRADFWAQFIMPVISELGVAYFLWKAVFDARGATHLGGYSFAAMMLYYLLVPLVDKAVRGAEWKADVASEIYEGTLTRYLVYPLPFLGYKLVAHLSEYLIRVAQLLLGVVIFLALFGTPSDVALSPISFLGGIVAMAVAAVAFFFLSASVSMTAFWADNVWSLQVMLRFMVLMLGGGLIPLSLFPEGLRQALALSPFPLLISFPIRTVLGQVGLQEWIHGLGMTAIWLLIFAGICRMVWQRGTRQYSGVGI